MIYKNITFKAAPFSYDLTFDDRIISMSFKSFVDIYLTDLEPRIKRNTFLTKKHITVPNEE